MLKKLLYLYNDGHNPFPSMGRGGLGYHLPNYPKVMHGDGFNIIRDENGNYIKTIDDRNDADPMVYDIMNPNGPSIVDIKDYTPDKPVVEDNIDFINQQIKELDKLIESKKTVKEDIEPIIEKVEKVKLEPQTEHYDELSNSAFDKIETYKTLRGKLNYINKLLDGNTFDPSTTEILTSMKDAHIDQLEEEKLQDKKAKYYVDIPEYEDEPVDTKDVEEIINKDLQTETIDEIYNEMIPNIDKIYTNEELPKFYDLFTDGQPLKDDDGNVVVVDGRRQNLYESGKDFETMVLNNPELLNTVIRQIYGNDVTVQNVKSDSNIKEDPAHKGRFTNYDAYTVVLKHGNETFTVSIEMKKYDKYFDVEEDLLKPSERDYKKFIAKELKNEGLSNIQDELNEIKKKYTIGTITKEEYKEYRKPYIEQKSNLYSKVIKPLSGNQNTKFSFSSKIGLPMKYTKVPLNKDTEKERPYHSKEIVSHISSLQANPYKTKKKAIEDTTNAVTGKNDILFLILAKGALLGQSYKKYLEKFGEEHIIDTAQLTTGPYEYVRKGAKKGSVDHYNINFHNMEIIDTTRVPNIDKKKLKEMREIKRKERLKEIKKI